MHLNLTEQFHLDRRSRQHRRLQQRQKSQTSRAIRRSSYFTAWILLSLIVLVPCLRAQSSNRILDIKRKIFCDSDTVFLVDLVTNNVVLTADEKALAIMETPVSVFPKNITLTDLAYSLQQYPQLSNVYLRGSDTITIENRQASKIIAMVRQQLFDHFDHVNPWKDWDIDIRFDADDKRRIHEIGSFKKIKVMKIYGPAALGNVSLRLAYFDESDRLISENAISPELVRHTEAVVLRHPQERGTVLSSDDLQKSPMWIGSQNAEYITELKECIGRELSRRLPAGTLLRSRHLLNPVYAKRGETVWVTCKIGGLSARVAVTAIESGRMGEQIRVRNPSSDKVFEVELVGRKDAVISFGG